MDDQKNLFGVTYYGGEFGKGTVFELKREHHRRYKFLALHSFNGKDGENPYSALIVDIYGNLYGVTLEGGAKNKGVIFEISPGAGRKAHEWTEKVLHNFCSSSGCSDGEYPGESLSYAGFEHGAFYDGVSPLYGTASGGGEHDGGTAFILEKSRDEWKETVIHHFCSKGGSDCSDGNGPASALLPDEAGNLYGITSAGGIRNQLFDGGGGVVFELLAEDNWSEQVLFDFCSLKDCADGYFPSGNLTMDSAGNIFGVTGAGGVSSASCDEPFGCGTIYELAPTGNSWDMRILHYFCQEPDCTDGQLVYEGVVRDANGNLFGTTLFGGGNDIDMFGKGGGVIYELSGSTYKILYRFCSTPQCTDGSTPFSQLVMNKFGRLFGTTEFGGASAEGGTFGAGDVFELRPPY